MSSSSWRFPRGRWPRLAIALLLALAITDLTVDCVSEFWVDHALFAGLISGAVLLFVTVSVVNDAIKVAEEQRSARVANQLGQMLARQAERVVSDSRRELAAMREEREEAAAARKAEQEKARSKRPLRRRFGERVRILNPREFGSAIMDGMSALSPFMPLAVGVGRVASELHAAREIQRELTDTIERRTAELEAGLATAVPFLAGRDDGPACLEAGFALVERLHEAGRATSIEAAEATLAGNKVEQQLSAFRGLASKLGGA